MTSRLSFVSANGETYPLDGSDGIRCVNLIEGLVTIPTDLLIEQRVAADGASLTQERRGPRRVLLDFMILGDWDKLDVMANWARLQLALAAGGKFVFDGPHGLRELREITYESATRESFGEADDDVFAVSLLALDPYWYGPVESVLIPFAPDTAWNAAIAWNAEIPWNGGGGVTFATTGDVEPFPMFVAGGGLSELTVALGNDSSVFWQIDVVLPGDLGPTDVVTVDHRPGYRGPRYGTDLIPGYVRGDANWTLLSEPSRVTWPLPLGTVDLVVGVAGDGANTFLEVFWESRWLAP